MRLFFPATHNDTRAIIDWVDERLPEHDEFVDSYAVAVISSDGSILAGAIFSSYSGNNVFLSGAISKEGIGRVTRGHLHDMIASVFKEPLNCLRMTALVSPTNKRSQRFVKRLGFVQEGTLRDYMAKDSKTLVFGLTKTDFEEGRYGGRERWRGRAAS